MRAVTLTLWMFACAPKAPPVPGPLAALADAERHAMKRPPPPPEAAPEADRARPRRGGRSEVAAAARRLLTAPPPPGYRADCSGFVEATLRAVEVDLRGSTATMWETLSAAGLTHRRPRPSPGDLAFFDNTYDRDDDGRRDDDLTHVAVVIQVDEDGTITLAHDGTRQGRDTLRMNLLRPEDRTDGERVLNEPLRARLRGDPDDLPVLASQLWRGFSAPPAP